jgi:hypothetical protein
MGPRYNIREPTEVDDVSNATRHNSQQGWGALVSSAIGRLADPAKLIGIHFN